MVNIWNVISNILEKAKKEIFVSDLPSCGKFYNDDFKIFINKVSDADKLWFRNAEEKAKRMTDSYDSIRKLLFEYASFSSGYDLDDLCYSDFMYLFWELVKHSVPHPVRIAYKDGLGNVCRLDVGPENFVYFDYDQYAEFYNPTDRTYDMLGYKFSLVKMGVEDSVMKYIMDPNRDRTNDNFKDKEYYFIYFCSKYKRLDYNMIETLIDIYNDMDRSEVNKLEQILIAFYGIHTYEYKGHDDTIVTMDENINLSRVFG